MHQRLVLLVSLLTLVGCRSNHEGAVKLTVSYTGFKPGCLRVGVRDAAGGSETRTTELAGKGEATGGTVTVAAFREAGWSSTLAVTAEAFEKACQGTPVTTTEATVTVEKGAVAEKELALAATDSDKDGYVSRSEGGTDCDDARAEAYPGAQELCNAQDDNCDRVKDEGFELGAVCDAANGCKGAWVCGTQGARACETKQLQWRPDVDKDGRGSKQATGVSSCQQPDGHVPNDLDCDDNNPRRYTGALELCNAQDDDCDGNPDNGLDVGALCTGVGGCGGNRACVADGGVECNSPKPTLLYPDSDLDQRGKADAGISSCEPTRPGYVTDAGDCDDSRANVYAGAPEICDEQDNDCDGTRDEGYTLDAGCDPGQGCSGVTACAADGGTRCAYVTPPSNYYPDNDLDQHGKADAGVLTCTPDAGFILAAGDCNDGNPFTHADAPELCDLEDNNCDGTADEGVCPADGGTWVDHQPTGTTEWRSVSLWGDGGVWVVGPGGQRARKQPGETALTFLSSDCSADWLSVWANPSTGRAYLGGAGGKLGIHEPNATSCTSAPPSAGDSNTWGLWGFASGGAVDIHGVGYNNTPDGRVFRWNGDASAQSVTNFGTTVFNDVHGLSPSQLFAVGGFNITRIYRFNPGTGTGAWESVSVPLGMLGLNAVWVVHPNLAFAVGRDRAVARWNGQAWSAHPVALTLAGGSEDLTGVLAFGDNALYVVSASGNLFYFNGQSWTKLHSVSGVTLYDIAGTRPDDLWMVGNGGNILHWPR